MTMMICDNDNIYDNDDDVCGDDVGGCNSRKDSAAG